MNAFTTSNVTLKRAVSMLLGAVLALVLAIAPLQTDAKAKTKPQTSKKAGFKSNGKALKVVKSNRKPVASNKAAVSKTTKNGKVIKSTPLAKGMKVAYGKQKFKRVKYFVPAAPSVGMLSGLHATPDPLSLKSGVALVVDANTSQVLMEKNAATALPIASITKLMTALVVVDTNQDLNERLTIAEQDVQLEKFVRSRLTLGTEMTRREAMQLALMSSENRAANMLTRYYPGGKQAFVDAMNRKAAQLGMRQSYFVEGTGLASANVASAYDLVKLVKATQQYPLLRELSTQSNYTFVDTHGRETNFHTTNRLIANPNWDISLQKTGFINAAGQCLVMSTVLDGRSVIMVFLDSAGKLSRLGDAQRVRDWLASNPMATLSGKPVSMQSQPSAWAANAKPTATSHSQHAQQMLAWSPK
jgi:serine-type D-Ala-D-Ala endopeptidase (penicillin-binding protein 7)